MVLFAHHSLDHSFINITPPNPQLRRISTQHHIHTPMRLENSSIGPLLSSKDESKLLHALLSLYRQCVASRSIANYVPVLIDLLCSRGNASSTHHTSSTHASSPPPQNPLIIHLTLVLLQTCLDYLSYAQKCRIVHFIATQFLQTGNFALLRDLMEMQFGADFKMIERYFLMEAPLIRNSSAPNLLSAGNAPHETIADAFNHSVVGFLIHNAVANAGIFSALTGSDKKSASVRTPTVGEILSTPMATPASSASFRVPTPTSATLSAVNQHHILGSMNEDQKIVMLNFIHYVVQLSYEAQDTTEGAQNDTSSTNSLLLERLYHNFYLLLLDKINDSQQEVSYVAFHILRELFCDNSTYHSHFHAQILPIRLNKHNTLWIHKFLPHYNLLLTRLKCMGLKRRFIGLRPLTYLTLYLQQQEQDQVTVLSPNEPHTANGNSHNSNTTNPLTQLDISGITQLLTPLLTSIDSTTVMEAAHCILLLSFDPEFVSSELITCTNHGIDQAVLAYVSLLNRELPQVTYMNLFEDICALINCVRDKYYLCSKLIDHISLVADDSCRMYVLTCIFRTLIQISVHSKLKSLYDASTRRPLASSSPSAKYHTTELTQFFKEPFMRHIWGTTAATKFEKHIRTEILFCTCREYLSLCATNIRNVQQMENDDERGHFFDMNERAWISVGVEIVENGKECLLWDRSTARNAAIAEFSRVLTYLCIETCHTDMLESDERKRVQQILRSILDDIDQSTTEFGKLVSVCILSNYIHLHKISSSGKETGDAVFELTQHMIRETLRRDADNDTADGGRKKTVSSHDLIRIDILLYAMMSVCLRFPIKLRDSQAFLEDILKSGKVHVNNPLYESLRRTLSKIQYSNKFSVLKNAASNHSDVQVIFGSAFDQDHYVFQSYYTRDDDKILLDYVKALQKIIDTSANLHNSDPFHVLQSSTAHSTASKLHSNDSFILRQPRMVQVAYKTEHATEKYVSRIISYPSDPLVVNASYTFSPHQSSLELRINLKNPTSLNIHKMCVEIGVQGAFNPSGDGLHATKIVGTLEAGATFSFSQEFTLAQFSRCSFMVVVLGSSSHEEKETSTTAAANEFLMSATAEGRRRHDEELIRIRCVPIEVQLMHMLKKPLLLRHPDFLTLWETFQSAHHIRLLISSTLSVTETMSRIMQNTPFFCVKSSPNQIKNDMFQICYASRTLFGDFLLLVVFGNRDYSGHVICDCEFRSVSPSIINALRSDDGLWMEKELLQEDQEHGITNVRVLTKDSFSKAKYDIFENTTTDCHFIDVEKAFSLEKLQQQAFHLKKWSKIRERISQQYGE